MNRYIAKYGFSYYLGLKANLCLIAYHFGTGDNAFLIVSILSLLFLPVAVWAESKIKYVNE